MLINRIPLYLVAILCFATVYTLFNIKENVMTLRFELKEVKKQLQSEQDTIHILKAELAYLASPDRIKVLSEQYLQLKTIKVTQMITDPFVDAERIANLNDSSRKLFASKNASRKVKWRYKKGPIKYLTTVSEKR